MATKSDKKDAPKPKKLRAYFFSDVGNGVTVWAESRAKAEDKAKAIKTAPSDSSDTKSSTDNA